MPLEPQSGVRPHLVLRPLPLALLADLELTLEARLNLAPLLRERKREENEVSIPRGRAAAATPVARSPSGTDGNSCAAA